MKVANPRPQACKDPTPNRRHRASLDFPALGAGFRGNWADPNRHQRALVGAAADRFGVFLVLAGGAP